MLVPINGLGVRGCGARAKLRALSSGGELGEGARRGGQAEPPEVWGTTIDKIASPVPSSALPDISTDMVDKKAPVVIVVSVLVRLLERAACRC